MPHLDCAHTAKLSITFHHSVVNVRAENTIYVNDPTDAIFTNPLATANQLWAAFIAHVPAVTADVVVYDGVIFEDIRALPYVGTEFPQTPVAGALATGAGALPTSACLAIKKLTPALGRSGRGRWYQPIWASGELSGVDTVSTAHANAIVTALAAFQAAMEGGALTCQLGIVSQQHGGVVLAHGLFEHIVLWTYTDTLIDNQRKRLLGRGS